MHCHTPSEAQKRRGLLHIQVNSHTRVKHKGYKRGTLLLPKHTSSTIINNKHRVNVNTDARMESGSSILQKGKKTDLQLLHEWHTVTLQLSQSCVGET